MYHSCLQSHHCRCCCRSSVSVVIVFLNIILKTALWLLVGFEKHWSRSEAERAYAVVAFVSQLINTVVVLLLVNAKFDSAVYTINQGLQQGDSTSW